MAVHPSTPEPTVDRLVVLQHAAVVAMSHLSEHLKAHRASPADYQDARAAAAALAAYAAGQGR